jgi:hypothetical protein
MKSAYKSYNSITIDQDLPFINTENTSMDILKETKRIANQSSLYKTFTKESRDRVKNRITLTKFFTKQTSPEPKNYTPRLFYAEVTKRYATECSITETSSKVTNNHECCLANLREYLNYNFEEMQLVFGSNLLDNAYLKMRQFADFSRINIVKSFKSKEKRVDLKIKSVTLELYQDEKVLMSISLPFEFIVIFSLCNLDTIILVLSQILKIEEGELRIQHHIADVIRRLETITHFEVKNRYSFNKDLKFSWVSDKGIMKAVLRRPTINLKIKNKNLTLKKIFDIKLFLYLFSKDFDRCEDYILTDLVSNKLFRKYFQSALSKFYIPTNEKLNLDGIMISENVYSEVNHSVCTIYTNKGKNYFLKFNSFGITSRKMPRHALVINWKRSFSLLRLSEILNLENCINRRTKYNEKTDEFVFEQRWLDNVNSSDISFYKENTLMKKKNFIKVINPYIEYQSLANNRVSRSKISIKDNLIKKMLSYSGIDDLYIFVSEYMNELIDSDESIFVLLRKDG